MKTVTQAVLDVLTLRIFNAARLYHFSLVSGIDLYYTSYDVDIKFGGHTYSAGGTIGPYFDTTSNKSKAHWKVGLAVDTMVFDVIPGTATIDGGDFPSAVRNGLFDKATLNVYDAVWAPAVTTSPIIPAGLVPIFTGWVGNITGGRTKYTFSINSFLEILNQNLPRNLYQSGCLNTLYDGACTLNQASFAVNSTAGAVNTAGLLQVSLSQASGYFDLGKLQFTSGNNAGVWAAVKTYLNGTPGSVALVAPLPVAPANGDAFTIYPGCDKLQATCLNKFNNAVNFRGMRFIPENSTAV